MLRRSLRQTPRISYCEPEEPNLDEYVYCEKCGDDVYEYCSIHGGLLVIPDDKVSHPSPQVPRAALTVPSVFLHLNYSSIPGAGLGIFSTLTLPSGVRFGPYRGIKTQLVDSDYCWQIYDSNRKPRHLVDASDSDKSNWMRYVNCARHFHEQNLVAFQYQGELYYRTIKIIPRYSELLVYYGTEYAAKLNIDIKRYNSSKNYVHTYAAPPPKKPKIAIENTKLQNEGILKPTRDNKQTDKPGNVENTKVNFSETSNEAKAIEDDVLDSKEKPKKVKGKPKQKAKILQRNENPEILFETKELDKNIIQEVHNKENNLNTTVPKQPTKEGKQNSIKKIVQNVYFFCDFCDYKNIAKKNLEKHMRFHDTTRMFVCLTCKYRFASEFLLKTHLKIHTGEKPFTCDICNYKTTWARHLKKHTGEKPYNCDICNYKTTWANALKSHLKTHTGEKPYTCDICNYKTTQASNLKTHMRTHTDDKPYTCDICNYKSSHACHLKTHLRTHTGEKPYTCDICNYKTVQAGNLKRHLRTHTGEKPYTCDICNYKTTQASTLKSHLRTHTGEKPYNCDICNFKTTQAGNLKTHLRIHTGEKPYTCDICNYKFSRANSLQNHIRTHTGEKPYTCDICDYRSAYSSYLKTHLKTHLKSV